MFWRCFCGNIRSINFWPTINDVFSIHSSNTEDCHSPDCVTLYLHDANWNNLPIDKSVSIWKCCWAASVSTGGKRKYDELSRENCCYLAWNQWWVTKKRSIQLRSKALESLWWGPPECVLSAIAWTVQKKEDAIIDCLSLKGWNTTTTYETTIMGLLCRKA